MQNVIHALQADHSVLIFVAICLMSNWSEQAVPIASNLDYPEVLGLKVLPEPGLLLLPIDGIEVKLWALWLFRVEFDTPALTAAHLLWRLILLQVLLKLLLLLSGFLLHSGAILSDAFASRKEPDFFDSGPLLYNIYPFIMVGIKALIVHTNSGPSRFWTLGSQVDHMCFQPSFRLWVIDVQSIVDLEKHASFP